MSLRSLSVVAIMLGAGPALAAADLSVTITPPAGTHVYETGQYRVRVANIGNASANNVNLVVQLPRTHTSPQVYLLGELGAMSLGCNRVGFTVTCGLGTIKKTKFKEITFDLLLPENAGPLQIIPTATSNPADAGPGLNTVTLNAAPLNYGWAIGAIPGTNRAATNRHCTGTTLTSFFECELFPSSISGYPFEFVDGGSLYFPTAPPDVTAEWTLDSADQHLHIEYFDGGLPAATFDGFGVNGSCFEGITTFPSTSVYVSPYEICLQ